MMRRTGLAIGVALIVALRLPLAGRQLVVFPAPPVVIDGQSATPPSTRQVPIGTARISGVVSLSDSGQPARSARVMLGGSAISRVAGSAGGGSSPTTTLAAAGGFTPTLSRLVLTDDQGHFSFDRLPAGQFSITVSVPGYLSMAYGAKRTGQQGTSIHLGAGQQFSVQIALPKAGAITGIVTDVNGAVIPNASVQASRFMFVNGVRRLQQSGGTVADDRGAYRLANLQPGDYVVSVTPPFNSLVPDSFAEVERAIAAAPPEASVVTVSANTPGGAAIGLVPSYYPAATDASSAAVISVAANEERTGINITSQTIRSGAVRGTIGGIPTKAGVGVQVGLRSVDPMSDAFGGGGRFTSVMAGQFNFGNLPPGDYLLLAQTVPLAAPLPPNAAMGLPIAPTPPRQLDNADRLWAESSVSVMSGSTTNVDLEMQPGHAVSGIVQFESSQGSDPSAATITITPAMPLLGIASPPQAKADPDGRFTIAGVAPGQYLLRYSGPGAMKSAILNGVDTLDFPLEVPADDDVSGVVITLTDRFGGVDGSVTTAAGVPSPNVTIIVAPVDERYWLPGARRILTTRPATDGWYQFASLPSGSYMIGAVDDLEQGQQFDRDFLHTLAGAAVRVTVTDGTRTTQNLHVGR
jgi:hypothetical protein